jgi:hypothetical protein
MTEMSRVLSVGTALFAVITASAIAQTQSLSPSPGWAHIMPAGPDRHVKITEEYARLVARDAFFWAWPMANLYARRLASMEAPEPILTGGVPIAPLNRLFVLPDYADASRRDVACPNQELIEGHAVLALDKSPVVVQVPDFGDRFWVYEIVDLRTDSFAQLGKMHGTTPGFYLLVGPNWQGEVPNGITKVFRASSKTAIVVPRVFQADTPKDRLAIQAVIQGIDLYPLAEYDGNMKRRDWRKLPQLTKPMKSGDDSNLRWVSPTHFFDRLPAVLDDAPPLPGEEARYYQVLAVVDAAARDSTLKQIMMDEALKAEKEMIVPLLQFRNFGIALPHNWSTIANGAQFGTDYFTRTAVAASNILVNAAAEAKYFYQDLDGSGERLNGIHRYRMTFPKGRTPPVNGFWSLTLFDEHHFFSPNLLKRYSLGTKDKSMKYNPDGSLTVYIQADPPIDVRRSNWLPSPKTGNFSLHIRAYWPKPAILDQSWTPPAVEIDTPRDQRDITQR